MNHTDYHAPSPKAWSPAECADLERLWREGLSCSECARKLHAMGHPQRTRNSVIGRVHRMGLQGVRGNAGVKRLNGANRGVRASGAKSLQKLHRKQGHKPMTAEERAAARALNKARAQAWAAKAVRPEGGGVPLLKLRGWMCRAVTENITWGDARYCGQIVARGVYCDHHAQLYYATGGPRKRTRSRTDSRLGHALREAPL